MYIYYLFLVDLLPDVGRALLSVDDLGAVETNFLGKMNFECKLCSVTEREDKDNPALYFEKETISSFCCNHGKCILDLLQPVPDLAIHITRVVDNYEDYDEKGRRFDKMFARDEYLEVIRHLNSSFAFVSMGLKLDIELPGRGPFVFRIHGDIRHLIGSSLIPPLNTTAKYASLYFIEPKQALAARVSESANKDKKIPRAVFESLQKFILTVSPYAKSFNHLYEVEQQQQRFVFAILD